MATEKKADRCSTEETAAIIRESYRKKGLPEPTYDQSMKRAAEVARDSERKGNR